KAAHVDRMGVEELEKADQLNELAAFRGLIVALFWAPWSQPCSQMLDAAEELSKEYDNVKFLKIEAEKFPEISLKYEVVAVPTFVFFKAGSVVDKVNGARAPEVAKKTAQHSQTLAPPPVPAPPKEDLNERLKKLINLAPCTLFMKGVPEEPRCGFSRQMVELLQELGAEFATFNILSDQEVRDGLKTFSNWPTFPQLYINGELIGGLDIAKEMKESGELAKMLPKKGSLEARLKALIRQAPVMIFMKGTPESPCCGFSNSLCQILKEANVEFQSFDILQDEEVRQGLKKFSNWPTYPQLYANGELIGGLDIVKELKESGELVDTLRAK
ncbi:hypothetical protein EMCRGX_G028732, partial [Ephydatia muelleri]